jgi:hypothetical protein
MRCSGGVAVRCCRMRDAANSAQVNIMGLAQSTENLAEVPGRSLAHSAGRIGLAVAAMIAPISSRLRAAGRAVHSQIRRRRYSQCLRMRRSKS